MEQERQQCGQDQQQQRRGQEQQQQQCGQEQQRRSGQQQRRGQGPQEPLICGGGLAGGPSELKPVTPEIQAIADSSKSDVEKELKRTFDVYVVVAYRTQVVAGTNHILKIHCGNDEYLHVKVYETLPHAGSVKSVTSAVGGKSVDDEF